VNLAKEAFHMAGKSGNNIEVNLKLLQGQEMKLLRQAAKDFLDASRIISTSMQGYAGQVAGHAANAGGTHGGTHQGRSRPAQAPLDPTQTGHDTGKSYARLLLERRQENMVNQFAQRGSMFGGAGAFMAKEMYAPGMMEPDLMARLRSGNIGEATSRDFIQYLAYAAGSRGTKINPDTGMVDIQGRGYMAKTSAGLTGLNWGMNMASSGKAFAQQMGAKAGMGFDQNALFTQMGYNPLGWGNTQFFSDAWKKRIETGVGISFQAAMKPGWGKAQERSMRESMLSIGLDPSRGGRDSMIAADLRDASRASGLGADELVSMGQDTYRYGTKKQLDSLTDTFKNLASNAAQANMTTAQFAKGVVALAQTMQQATGMSSADALKMASGYQAVTGMSGDVSAGMMSSPMMTWMTVAQNHLASPSRITGRMTGNTQVGFVQTVVGAKSPEDLKRNWESKYRDKYSNLFTASGGSLFGGIDEAKMSKIVRGAVGQDDAMNQLAAGMHGKNLSSKQIDKIAQQLLGKNGKEYDKWKEAHGDTSGYWHSGIGKRHEGDKKKLKAIEQLMKKSHHPAPIQLGLTSEASKLVKQLGLDDKAHSNKTDHSRSANPGTVLKHMGEGFALGGPVGAVGALALDVWDG
jgi:hypothetical protein